MIHSFHALSKFRHVRKYLKFRAINLYTTADFHDSKISIFMVFRMFSRRNRGFLGTCFVLISIVCFGYGLYMYDLKSVKLSESQAMLHRTERSAAQLDKKVEKLKSEKKSLEEQLENVNIQSNAT